MNEKKNGKHEILGHSKIGTRNRIRMPKKVYDLLNLTPNDFLVWSLEKGKLFVYKGSIEFDANKVWC